MFGWSTKGYYVCPVCKEDTTSSWQAGKFCYLGHCKWLLWDHEWRQNEIAFFNDIELQQRPREWSGDETLAQFPDGYASNISNCTKVDGGKFFGLKGHDCHVILQHLLPVGI
ncbi:hypothetical protein ACFXTH_022318 [Malus domestica]